MDEIKTEINVDELRSRSIKIPYPHIKIVDLSNAVPLVISSLEDGDIPLIVTFKGKTKIVKKIDRSALNISKLLRVTAVNVVLSVTEIHSVLNVKEYMEVLIKWI